MATRTKSLILNQQDADDEDKKQKGWAPAPASANNAVTRGYLQGVFGTGEHPNGGTQPTGNDGEEPVNDGAAQTGGTPQAKTPVTTPEGEANANASGTVVGGNGTPAVESVPTTASEQVTPTPPEEQRSTPTTDPQQTPGKNDVVNDGSAQTGGTPYAGGGNAGTTDANASGTVADASGTDGDGDRVSMKYMIDYLNANKPMSEEERKKEEKKEKREKLFAAIGDGIAALANLHFTAQGAPNAYDPRESMSEKTQKRWDKLNAERKDNDRAYMNAYMQALKMQQDKDRNDQLQNNWRAEFEFKQGEADKAHNQWQQTFNYTKEKDQRDFDENVRRYGLEYALKEQAQREQERHNKAGEAISRQSNSIHARQVSMQEEGKYTNFLLGDSGERIRVKTSDLNGSNIKYVFSKLPAEVQKTAGSQHEVNGMPMGTYKKPTEAQMLEAIGEHVNDYPEVQDALRRVGGSTARNSGSRGRGY